MPYSLIEYLNAAVVKQIGIKILDHEQLRNLRPHPVLILQTIKRKPVVHKPLKERDVNVVVGLQFVD